MDIYLISIFTLLAISLFLSLMILILLLCIKHKDFSILLKIQLITYDLMQEVSAILIALFLPRESSSFTFSSCCILIPFFYSRFIHNLLLVYMSYVLLKLVVKKVYISNRDALVFAFISNLAAFLLGSSFIIMCYCIKDLSLVYTVYFIASLDIPSILIECILVYFYFRIRKTLKIEYMQKYELRKNDRSIAAQLIGYPLVFFMFNLCNLFYLFYFWVGINDSVVVSVINLFAFAIYPILNSLVYGFSNSTKRLLFAMCLRNKDYAVEAQLEEECRQFGLIEKIAVTDLIAIK
jgi:hypothetical protein